MEDELLIRIGTLNDLDVLVKFNQAMADETEGKELTLEIVTAGVETLLKNPSLGFYLLAEKNGEVAGALMVTTEWSDWHNGLYWWIQSVYVHPEFRRQGVYKKLYNFVKDKAKNGQHDLKIWGFRLYAERQNTIAKKAYEALGMKETSYKIYEEEL